MSTVALSCAAAMIAADLALHVRAFATGRLWPWFKTRRRYEAFWCAYWSIALALVLLGATIGETWTR